MRRLGKMASFGRSENGTAPTEEEEAAVVVHLPPREEVASATQV